MNTKFYKALEEKKLLIAAHRGSFGGSIIDNTELSAKVAISLGADIVELDAIRSTDGVLYTYHDGGEKRSFEIDKNIKTLSSKEIKELVKRYKDNLPECFFVNGDEKAIVLIRELFNYGIKIPQDVKVMGFDNLPLSEYMIPSLTTVSMNYKELATKLLDKLLNIMEGKEEESEEVESTLIIRESTENNIL